MHTLEIQQVTKRYGHDVVVDDLSFTVRPGRVTGFLGPNGAGKSTTMKILLDLASADRGHASIGGTRYRDLADPARNGRRGPRTQRVPPRSQRTQPSAGPRGRRRHPDGAHRRPARAGGAGARRAPARRCLLAGHAATARPGRRTARRPTGPGPRRTGQRTRPPRHPLAPRPAARTCRGRRHGLRLQPPARRGRAPGRRPRGDQPRPSGHHWRAGHPAASRYDGAHTSEPERLARLLTQTRAPSSIPTAKASWSSGPSRSAGSATWPAPRASPCTS